jgi:hemerythrin
MAELSWCDKYAVGVDAIDDDHKELFDAVRGLESAMARFAAPAEMGSLLNKLSAATAKHFADEVAMMREAKYPGLALHEANHQRLMEKVDAFTARHSQNGATVNQHALNFLRDWLLHHIENDDARLGAWLKEHKPA